MTFSGVVEVTSIFPGTIGGCIFWGIPEGKKRSMPFKVSYKVGIRNPCVGERWHVKGQLRPYDKYTKEVRVHDAKFDGLPKGDYLAKFLGAHPRFRGFNFGKKGAENLVGKIGAPELAKLLNKGAWKTIADFTSDSAAQRICEEWFDLKEETEVVTFLAENNLGADLSRQIIRLCKFNTVERLKRNPYALIALSNCRNVKMLNIISTVAKAQGISVNDDRALIGCVEYALYRELHLGHTITEVDMATENIQAYLCDIGSEESAETAIKLALAAKAVCIYEVDGRIFLQPISLAYIERNVEKTITSLHKMPTQENLLVSRQHLPARIEEYSVEHKAAHGWGFTSTQCCAVEMALTNRLSLLSGYGGTGKTAVLKAVYDLAIEMGIPVYVAALAGKASNRAKRSINADDNKVSTLHTMIKLIEEGSKFSVDIYSDPLLVIDETSMVDISLICRLIRLFDGNPFRMLLVGDSAQLPPIGFGLFWHKLVNSNAPHTKLTEVHRMVKGSALHKCAMNIRNGVTHQLPVYQGEAEGVYLMPNVTDYTAAIVKLRNTFDGCMVLTSYASSRFSSSTKTLNPTVQAIINPPITKGYLMKYGTTTLHANDPVLATKNAHKLGIFNGMTGIINDICVLDAKLTCHVKFDDELSTKALTTEDCFEIGLQLAYLITIHKSQGSEYDNAAILLDSQYLERSALYTALTRTKKLCILVGSNIQYNAAISRPASYESIRSGFNPVF